MNSLVTVSHPFLSILPARIASKPFCPRRLLEREMIGTVARMGHNFLMVAFAIVTVVLVLQII
jgi:hypothetical protein